MKQIKVKLSELTDAQRAEIVQFWTTKKPPPSDAVFKMVASPGTPAPEKTPPVAQWPKIARWIAKLRSETDAGVGDTLHRLINAATAHRLISILAKRFGLSMSDRSNWMSVMYEKITGKACGCQDRQSALNRRYPYPRPERSPAPAEA